MTARQLYVRLKDSFKDISCSPEADARALILHILGLDGAGFMLRQDDEVDNATLFEAEKAMGRRLDGEPIAYIIGSRGFYEDVFKVSKDTLIPRADTETLVESSISDLRAMVKQNGLKDIGILDMCCGTGCIGISVAKVLRRDGLGVSLTLSDLSDGALMVCRQNVSSLIHGTGIKVQVVKSDLFSQITGSFNAILSNPPYIDSAVLPTLERQVLFEPRMALDGGTDGLDFVRAIIRRSMEHLEPGGTLQLEIGHDQSKRVERLLETEGFGNIRTLKDLGGNDRVVKGLNKY